MQKTRSVKMLRKEDITGGTVDTALFGNFPAGAHGMGAVERQMLARVAVSFGEASFRGASYEDTFVPDVAELVGGCRHTDYRKMLIAY